MVVAEHVQAGANRRQSVEQMMCIPGLSGASGGASPGGLG